MKNFSWHVNDQYPLQQTATWPDCAHSFTLNMVIPAGGCYVSCPNCGATVFIRGSSTTC